MQVELLDEIEAVGSRLSKEELLRKIDRTTKRMLAHVCDPMVTFGVTVDEDYMTIGWKVCTSRMRAEMYSDAFYNLCLELRDRTKTGNLAANAIRDLLTEAPTASHLKWSCRILNKKLRAGIQASTLNKVFPGLIDEFEVALATPYDPDKHSLVGDWFFEPKLDGLRMVVIGGKAYTRNGRPIETVDHVLDELGSYIDLDRWVLDGEIMGVGDFDESSGTIRRKSTGKNEELYYNIFDVVRTKEEWIDRSEPTAPFSVRRKRLLSMVKESMNVKIVLSTMVTFTTPAPGASLMLLRDQMIAAGYEGAMAKDANAPYEWKRGTAVLKLKKMLTIDGQIAGSYEGKGRHKGRLGGFLVRHEGQTAHHLQVVTKVGGGYSDLEREELWKKRKEVEDLTVEIQYQNKSADGRLRFPVFIKFRPDKD